MSLVLLIASRRSRLYPVPPLAAAVEALPSSSTATRALLLRRPYSAPPPLPPPGPRERRPAGEPARRSSSRRPRAALPPPPLRHRVSPGRPFPRRRIAAPPSAAGAPRLPRPAARRPFPRHRVAASPPAARAPPLPPPPRGLSPAAGHRRRPTWRARRGWRGSSARRACMRAPRRRRPGAPRRHGRPGHRPGALLRLLPPRRPQPRLRHRCARRRPILRRPRLLRRACRRAGGDGGCRRAPASSPCPARTCQ